MFLYAPVFCFLWSCIFFILIAYRLPATDRSKYLACKILLLSLLLKLLNSANAKLTHISRISSSIVLASGKLRTQVLIISAHCGVKVKAFCKVLNIKLVWNLLTAPVRPSFYAGCHSTHNPHLPIQQCTALCILVAGMEPSQSVKMKSFNLGGSDSWCRCARAITRCSTQSLQRNILKQ